MFQFPAFASRLMRDDSLKAAGLSHSDIRGSQAVCAYPRLFAAYHVLHRLREPRHPPCALARFPFLFVRHPIITDGAACAIMSKILRPKRASGEYRTRTDDPLLARQAL